MKVKRWILGAGITVAVILLLAVFYTALTWVTPPEIADMSSMEWAVERPSHELTTCRKNWLHKSKNGLWEMYLEGTPFERGAVYGKMSRQLLYIQEKAFVDRIREMIPSDFYLRFLKYFIYWFNRDLDAFLSAEFREEIYGVSRSASDEYNFIGSRYRRMLNYHSAHDIGHALQELGLVGCTSFGVWNSCSSDSGLIIGRNFDFYMGDSFAENKIVLFERPDRGHPFMMITWPGMTGAVSGMNLRGLTVTINAARSEIPYSARTPVSVLAREILQYAGTINEAYTIAASRSTFISESLLIGSAADNRAVIIEKSPHRIGLKEPDDDYIICANHFQSAVFRDDPLNIENMRDNASVYRSQRLSQDLAAKVPLDPYRAAWILRDRFGLNGKPIGTGNEKAINQMLAHHSVIFQPSRLLVWVSTSPWQLGTYACYDLSEIFHNFAAPQPGMEIAVTSLTIPADAFLDSLDFKLFLRFRELRRTLTENLEQGTELTDERSLFGEMVMSNPEYYETYSLIGEYHFKNRDFLRARQMFILSLKKEIPRQTEKQKIIRMLAACNVELNETN